MIILICLPVLIIMMLGYFRLAVQFKIFDRPNERSSHTHLTIRGGGIIFPIALFLQCIISGFEFPLFSLGLFLISAVSFYDDLKPLSNKLRLIAHLSAVLLMFIELDLISQPLWIIVIAFILVIGTINAYNFMDGINGITGGYSLLMAGSLYFINSEEVEFIPSQWLIVCILSLVVFNLFNFRTDAKCFAGDVGSISMAFILIYFVILLILQTGDIKYIALFLVYGLDTVTTIVFRLLRKENIFDAHRTHFYQFLVHSKLWPHLGVSALYICLQLLINALILYYTINGLSLLILVLISGIFTIIVRFIIEGKSHLLGLSAVARS